MDKPGRNDLSVADSASRASLDSKQTASDKPQAMMAPAPTSSAFTLTINNQALLIRSINISINGLNLAQLAGARSKPKDAEVELNLQGSDNQSLETTDATEPRGNAKNTKNGKHKKNKSFLDNFKPKHSNKKQPSVLAQATETAASTANTDASRGQSATGGDCDEGIGAESKPATPAAGSNANRRPEGNQSPVPVPAGDSSDDEIDMSPRLPPEPKVASASNTVESDTAGEVAGESNENENTSTVMPGKEAEKQVNRKRLFPPGWPNRSDRKERPVCSFNFPNDVPNDVKALFEITDDLRKPKATVYITSEGHTDDVKKQKRLLTEGSQKRFTVAGKSRSIWLDPAAGDVVEVWKEYFDYDGECKRALGRLVGTDKYGYIVPDEVDLEKEFPSREEKLAYVNSLQELVMFQNAYGEADDDEQYM